MLRTYACFDMFAELLNRKQFRSAAAIFIDAANFVEPLLQSSHQEADRVPNAQVTSELDEKQEELSAMWKLTVPIGTTPESANPQTAAFRELMQFTLGDRASRSDQHKDFYARVTGTDNPVKSPLSSNTLSWFVGT